MSAIGRHMSFLLGLAAPSRRPGPSLTPALDVQSVEGDDSQLDHGPGQVPRLGLPHQGAVHAHPQCHREDRHGEQ